MSKTFPKKIDKNFNVSFSSTFFVLSRFRVFLSDGSSKTHKKNIVSKSFYKTFDQKTQNRFFLDFCFITGLFSVRGVQNTIKDIKKINLTPSLFCTLTHPPTTGVTDLFLGPAPCGYLPDIRRFQLTFSSSPLAQWRWTPLV
jgi:hypothetical protein